MAMRLHVRTVGRPDPLYREAALRYRRRLEAMVPVTWEVVPESRRPPALRPREEGRRLFAGVSGIGVLLDGRGQEWSSEELARRLARWLEGGLPVWFLVGGPYGVDDGARGQARELWSLSRLTLPHGLVPVIVLEQLYRAATILAGAPYHHGPSA
jgi:23S rRNA (pseudouridine1915-N3)-methyltransferase